MESYSAALIIRWLIPLWLWGWFLLPASRRVFPLLPDGGLAAGRLLALMLVALAAFWGASLHLISLDYAPVTFAVLPLAVLLFSFKHRQERKEFFLWLKPQRKALIVSDAIFIVGFLFFVYLRLCQPEIRDQEKPMDSAIIGALARTHYLPADNPWFNGMAFTNYYYFGHFMAALLTRAFSTPLPYAYNLLQPAFCAFFLSILWSLCAALTRSLRAGVLAMAMIALCGNYEPLRQLFSAWQRDAPLWPLDWWSTSRIVPGNINEYPFFTLALGDAHAHFFGLAMGALFLCLCYCAKTSTTSKIRRAVPAMIFIGPTLGALLMVNSWDVPLYFLLSCLWFMWPGSYQPRPLFTFSLFLYWALSPLVIASAFLWNFKPAVQGIAFESWPPPAAFLLHWGGFLIGAIFLGLHKMQRESGTPFNDRYPICISTIGAIAVAIPFVLYIRGHFDGDLRHQDTVFKFWLQAWLMLGTAISCQVSTRIFLPNKNFLQGFLKIGFLIACTIPLLCSWLVLQSRLGSTDAKRVLPAPSLDGARFLPTADQRIIDWLRKSAPADATIIEAVGRNADGSLIGAYTDFGRISFLSGIPTYLGWPQHTAFWGAHDRDILRRAAAIDKFYVFHGLHTRPVREQSPSRQSASAIYSSIVSSKNNPYSTLIVWADLEVQLFGEPSADLKHSAVFSAPNAWIFSLPR